MVGSAQHYLAKWLAGTLEPVLKLFTKHCIYDSFTFAKVNWNISNNPNNSFLYSFDVFSLYTNVLLVETIIICWCSIPLDPPFLETFFLKLMHIATKCIHFNSNNIILLKLNWMHLVVNWWHCYGLFPWCSLGKYIHWFPGRETTWNY